MSVLLSRILLATDGSEDAALATRAAVDISRKGGSELHLVHIWRDVPSPYAHSFVKRELERQGQEVLDKQAKRIEEDGGKVSGIHLRQGRISDEVMELSRELGADLLVVGSRGHGQIGRILMGSHSEEIVHRARLPVLVLRRATLWPPARLVIGDDYSENAKKAGELAASLGGLFGIREALLIRTYPRLVEQASDVGASGHAMRRTEKDLEARAAELGGVLGYRLQTKLAAGEAAREKDGSALVAVGSQGVRTSGRTRLGSTSAKVVQAAPGPVLVYPQVR
jgi:nucleotide-binding universal stress UspA family protein